MPDLQGQRALVTGASSGIGADMARILASWGCDLIITARRRERLEALASELRDAHEISVDVVDLDLGTAPGPGALWAAATDGGGRVDILINNAGFGHHATFADSSLERNLMMLQLNITSLVELSHRFANEALQRKEPAYILNVSSVGAFQPVPFFANYSATKAYVLSLSEALWGELRGTNVSCTCVCPGATRTEFFDAAEQKPGKMVTSTMISAEKVARASLLAMLKRRRKITTGFMNKLSGFLVRLFPTRFAMWAAARVVGQPKARAQLAPAPNDAVE